MEWQGVEWAVPVYELAMLVVPVAGFAVYRQRVVRQGLAPWAALWRYAALVMAPIVVAVAFFALLIAIEEFTDLSPMTEEMGRGLPLLIIAGLVIWLLAIIVFGLSLAFRRRPVTYPKSNPERGD